MNKKRIWWTGVALAALTVILYWPVTEFEFLNCDDDIYVVKNDMVRSGLTENGLRWAFTSYYASNWHPITWISHIIDCEMFGLNAGAHHFTNVVFHTANTVLLFWVLFEITTVRKPAGAALLVQGQDSAPDEAKNRKGLHFWACAFVAALFAVHPLHVESVAWVAERKDVLSGLFFLLTILAYAKYVASVRFQGEDRLEIGNANSGIPNHKSQFVNHKRHPFILYLLGLGLFALGLMSKPMLVTTPFVLLLLDLWPLGRIDLANVRTQGATIAKMVVEKLPFFALAAVDSYVTVAAQKAAAIVSPTVLPMRYRLANAATTYCQYLWHLVWPKGLTLFYGYSTHFNIWAVGASVLLLVMLTFCVLKMALKRPYLAVGWLLYLGMLVPVIGLVQVGYQSMADRYMYLPSIGIFLAIVWSIMDAWQRRAFPLRVLYALSGGIVLSLAVCTSAQLRYWHDSVSLFSRSVQVTGGTVTAEHDLAEAYFQKGDQEQARIHYLNALKLRPTSMEKSIHSQARSRMNLATILANRGEWQEAVGLLRSALDELPDHWQARGNLAYCLDKLGKPEEAVHEYERAVKDNPESAELWSGLGQAQTKSGKFEEGEKALRAAVRLRPNGSSELTALAWLLATCPDDRVRNGAEALQLAQRACELSVNDASSMSSLDAAYAETGDFENAIKVAKQVRENALARGDSEMAAAAEKRLNLYTLNKPYREHSQ